MCNLYNESIFHEQKRQIAWIEEEGMDERIENETQTDQVEYPVDANVYAGGDHHLCIPLFAHCRHYHRI